MPDNEKTVEQTQLETIEALKLKMDGMVDPAEYAKLKSQYDTLLNDYVNRRPAPKAETPKLRPARDIAKELSAIKSHDVSNREYIAKALEYRKAFIAETGKDPFGDKGQPTEDSQKVADTLEHLLQQYPNPSDFRHYLNQTLQDDPQLVIQLRKKQRAS